MLVKKYSGWIVCLLGLFLTLYFYFPGFMTNDSLNQLKEARNGVFTDLHPPLMAWCWRQWLKVLPSSVGMLVFHNVLFWLGLGLFTRKVAPQSWKAAGIALLIGFWPSVIGMLGMIWKDVGMGASFLLGWALLLHARGRKSIPLLLVSLGCFFYGYAVRPNSIIAVFPLWLAWVQVFLKISPWQNRRPPTALILTLLLALFQTSVLTLMNHSWVRDRHHYSYQALFVQDLAALSLMKEENLFPKYLRDLNPTHDLDWMKKKYSAVDIGPLLYDEGTYFVQDPLLVSELTETWWREVRNSPVDYLKHRLEHFWYFLSFFKGEPESIVLRVEEPPASYPRFSKGVREQILEPLLTSLSHTVIFSNGLYLILILGIFVRELKRPGVGFSLNFLLTLSGGLYLGAYALIGSGSNFRYIWWSVLCGLMALVGQEAKEDSL